MLNNIALILIIIIGVAWLMREGLWLKFAPPEIPNFYSLNQLPERNFKRDAHLCSEALCDEEKTDGAWPIYKGAPAQFQTEFLKIAQSLEPKARIVPIQNIPENSFRILTFAPTARFPDIIDIQLLHAPASINEFGVSVFARALMGKIDFDANKKRLEKIRAAFVAKID